MPSDPTAPVPAKRRLGVFVPPRPPLELAKDAARALDEPGARASFGLAGGERALKTTVSLCPECLAYAPALVFTQRGRVLIRKRCPTHGDRDAVLHAACDLLVAHGQVQHGDLIVVTIGEPMGKSGGTNTMKIVRVGEHRV